MNVGFVGLGSMGLPIARNLLRAGHRVTAWNRTRSRAEVLVAEGVQIAESPADACGGEALVTMLADDRAVEETLLSGNVLSGLGSGTTHVCMSTISVALASKLARFHADAGTSYVAAPVFGRPDAAEAAKLFVVAAGRPEDIQRVQPLLDAIGQKTFIVGDDPPMANVIKISGNFMIATVIESLGETLALVRKHGIDPARYLEVLTGSLFTAPVYRTYGALIAEERFEPAGFKLPLGLKDIKLALSAGEDASTPLPIASLIRDNMLESLAHGRGELDWSALALIAAEHAGLSTQKADGE